jgi:hypothetical protein
MIICPRCELGDHGTARRPDGVRHVATVPRPTPEQLHDVLFDVEFATATDGCDGLESDGHCAHGHVAWPRALGMI